MWWLWLWCEDPNDGELWELFPIPVICGVDGVLLLPVMWWSKLCAFECCVEVVPELRKLLKGIALCVVDILELWWCEWYRFWWCAPLWVGYEVALMSIAGEWLTEEATGGATTGATGGGGGGGPRIGFAEPNFIGDNDRVSVVFEFISGNILLKLKFGTWCEWCEELDTKFDAVVDEVFRFGLCNEFTLKLPGLDWKLIFMPLFCDWGLNNGYDGDVSALEVVFLLFVGRVEAIETGDGTGCRLWLCVWELGKKFE